MGEASPRSGTTRAGATAGTRREGENRGFLSSDQEGSFFLLSRLFGDRDSERKGAKEASGDRWARKLGKDEIFAWRQVSQPEGQFSPSAIHDPLLLGQNTFWGKGPKLHSINAVEKMVEVSEVQKSRLPPWIGSAYSFWRLDVNKGGKQLYTQLPCRSLQYTEVGRLSGEIPCYSSNMCRDMGGI